MASVAGCQQSSIWYTSRWQLWQPSRNTGTLHVLRHVIGSRTEDSRLRILNRPTRMICRCALLPTSQRQPQDCSFSPRRNIPQGVQERCSGKKAVMIIYSTRCLTYTQGSLQIAQSPSVLHRTSGSGQRRRRPCVSLHTTHDIYAAVVAIVGLDASEEACGERTATYRLLCSV